MKKSTKVLLYFSLNCGILYSRTIIQRTIDVSPAFLEKIVVGADENRDPNSRLDSYLHEAAQNFELLSNIQIKNKK
jgi:hypothetical protein